MKRLQKRYRKQPIYLLNAKIELCRFSERHTVEDIVHAEAFCEYNVHVFTFNTIVTGRPSDQNRFLNRDFNYVVPVKYLLLQQRFTFI